MKLMLQQHCQSVLTLFIIIAVMGLSGGNGRAQAPDTGLIKRDWRLVGVYVGEVGRTGNKLPAMGFVKVREANSKGGSADIEVRGATGLLFRQKFSWDFLQDMSMVKAGQPYKVMFRMEGERPTVNSGSVYLWFNGGASPKLWELYFPSVLKGPWVFNRTVGTPRSYVQIDPEGSSPNSSAEVEFLFEGDNGNSASVPAFSSFWFNPYIGNGVEFDSVEIHYLFAAEAIVPPGGAAVPPLTLPTDVLPPGATFYPPSGGSTVAPPIFPNDPSTPPVPPPSGNPPVPPVGEPFDTLQGQNCIREWAGLVEQIRNELYPDQGPWQFNQYGILENRAVTSAYEPDGWMSTYGGNPYLFIWLNGGREHENADYAGRLPSLYAYVAECSGGAVPTSGPGASTGPTPGSGGTGTPPGAGGATLPPGPTGPVTPPGDNRMTLQAGRLTMREGETLMIPVSLLNASDVADMNFTIRYDPAVALARDPTSKGNLLDQAGFECNTSEAGIVRVGFAQTADISGTGTVAQISFTATGAVGSRTPLRLEVTTISSSGNQQPSILTIDGEIVIVGPLGRIPGDSDGDGVITARDYGNALKMSVNLIAVDLICDMDKDGKVTSTDARLIAVAILSAR